MSTLFPSSDFDSKVSPVSENATITQPSTPIVDGNRSEAPTEDLSTIVPSNFPTNYPTQSIPETPKPFPSSSSAPSSVGCRDAPLDSNFSQTPTVPSNALVTPVISDPTSIPRDGMSLEHAPDPPGSLPTLSPTMNPPDEKSTPSALLPSSNGSGSHLDRNGSTLQMLKH